MVTNESNIGPFDGIQGFGNVQVGSSGKPTFVQNLYLNNLISS